MNTSDILTVIGDQKTECDKQYLTTGSYWKSLVGGIIVIVGLLGGVFAWSMSVTKVDAAQSERIRENREHIQVLEKSLNGKMDRILKAVEKR